MDEGLSVWVIVLVMGQHLWVWFMVIWVVIMGQSPWVKGRGLCVWVIALDHGSGPLGLRLRDGQSLWAWV